MGCDCPRHRDGPGCSRRLMRSALQQRCHEQAYTSIKECLGKEQGCLNSCNRRGTCVAGFCHCNPGHYGADCSLSLGPDGKPVLLAGSGYTTRAKRPWVYVYELPPELAGWFNFKRLDRPLHLYFWQRLLSSGARTADGDAADYYLLPLRQRSFSDSYLMEEAIQYVREHYPWWNRTGGAKHMVIHTDWGLTRDRQFMRWDKAFRPEKDVVIPVYISPGHFVKFGVNRSPLHPSLAKKNRTRDAATFFFAGRICYESKYVPQLGKREVDASG
ncbi:hypothetical protein GPECTOR_56g386 [Gonium pectorale]|uniref:EGF-like domain-containing protein n=1 Tax=Gonium pectorale TaxID=33097 RepID=A0A150G7H1_GONPE|nr:hypothetical protein GPECTOR_56g386 [Gonium pectorale]|eukprot:KXZ45290.1 hypothetical protein GPECTOR_56g386 [Gonium pectorale]